MHGHHEPNFEKFSQLTTQLMAKRFIFICYVLNQFSILRRLSLANLIKLCVSNWKTEKKKILPLDGHGNFIEWLQNRQPGFWMIQVFELFVDVHCTVYWLCKYVELQQNVKDSLFKFGKNYHPKPRCVF